MGLSTNLMGNEHAYQFIIGNTKVPLFYMPFQNPNTMTLTEAKEFNRTQTIGGQVFEHWGAQPMKMHVSMRIRKNGNAGNIIGIYDEKKYDLEDPMFCTELEIMKLMYTLDRRKLKWTFGDLFSKVTGGVSNLIGKGSKSIPVLSVATGNTGQIQSSAVSKGVINQQEFLNLDYTSSSLPSGTSATTGGITNWLNKLSDTIIIYKNNIYCGFFTNFEVTEDGSFPFCNVITFDFLVEMTIMDYIYDSIASTTRGRTIGAAIGATSAVTALGYFVDSFTTGLDSFKKFF